MNSIKFPSRLSLAFLVVLSLCGPARAGESIRVYAEEISKVDTVESQPKKSASRFLAGPAKALGITCGVMVGVPVRIAKDTVKYTGSMRKSMEDGLAVNEIRHDVFGRVVATGAAIPFGIGSGIVHGTVKGVETAVSVGGQKPLSKESMSLTDSE